MISRFAASLSSLLVLTSCALVGQRLPQPTPSPEQGLHPVGVVELTLPSPGGPRPVVVWYPAASGSDAPLEYEVEVAGVVVARLPSLTGAGRGAPPLRRPWPTLLFSHGYASTRYQNVGLAELFASHGYVVAAVDHAGTSMADMVTGIDAEQRARSAYDRPHELSKLLDLLVERSRTGDPLLGGMLDPKRVAVAGHSFGARAALAMTGATFDVERQRAECRPTQDDRRCAALPVFGAGRYRYRDPRVRAALLLTPAGFRFYRQDGVATVAVPTLVVGARRDHTNPYDEFHRPVYDALRTPRQLLELPEAGHLTATDVCDIVASIGFLARLFGGDHSRDGCGARFMSVASARDRVARASLAFLSRYLDGPPGPAAAPAEALALDPRSPPS